MEQVVHFEILSNESLSEINGGSINWGSVIGHCVGEGLVTGVFSGPFYLAGAGIGCIVGGGQALINGL